MGRASSSCAVNQAKVKLMERQQLTHCVPGRVSDHLAIRLVRLLRWISDRFVRERHIHRATMHLSLFGSSASAMTSSLRLRNMWGGSSKVVTAPATQLNASGSDSVDSTGSPQPTPNSTKMNFSDMYRYSFSEVELHHRHFFSLRSWFLTHVQKEFLLFSRNGCVSGCTLSHFQCPRGLAIA